MTDAERFLRESYDPSKGRAIDYSDDIRIRTVLSLIEPSGGLVKALDVACFNGEVAEQIMRRLGPACEMHGIDIADSLGELVERRGIHFQQADLNRGIDYPDDEFDFVFAGEIIEHMYDTEFFISELKRILEPGGRLIMTTPNMLSLGRRIMYLLGRPVYMEVALFFSYDGMQPAGHIRYFTRDSLVSLLAHHGFETVRCVSDQVNLPHLRLKRAAELFPGLGQTIICLFINGE